MNTTNIISTPDITGNIGSCQTNVVKQITRDGVFTSDGFTISTNSCNGNVEKLEFHSSNVLPSVFTGILVILIVLITVAILTD